MRRCWVSKVAFNFVSIDLCFFIFSFLRRRQSLCVCVSRLSLLLGRLTKFWTVGKKTHTRLSLLLSQWTLNQASPRRDIEAKKRKIKWNILLLWKNIGKTCPTFFYYISTNWYPIQLKREREKKRDLLDKKTTMNHFRARALCGRLDVSTKKRCIQHTHVHQQKPTHQTGNSPKHLLKWWKL